MIAKTTFSDNGRVVRVDVRKRRGAPVVHSVSQGYVTACAAAYCARSLRKAALKQARIMARSR